MARYRVVFLPHAKGGSEYRYLMCRVKWNSSRQIVALSMGYRITPQGWSTEAQRCKPSTFHGPAKTPAAEINAEIERYAGAAAAVFARLKEPTREDVAREMRAELGRADRTDLPTVIQAYRMFCAEQSAVKGWSDSTMRKMDVTGRHLEDSRLFKTFADVTPANLGKYLDWLRTDLDLTDTTAHRQIANVRWFLFWCEDHGFVKAGWRSFRPKFRLPEKPVVFLEWDELMKLWEYDDPKCPGRMSIRDLFCFCAFTSLRFSDAMALTWADVGQDAIRVTTVKTYDALTIELNKWSREILDRRKGGAGAHVFGRISNQAANRELKDLCRACGIDAPVRLVSFQGSRRKEEVKRKWEVIGTHAARRTFVVNALQMGISPTVVMQWTGHSDYKSMRPYIAVADSARARAMSGFDKLSTGATDSATDA